MLKLSRTGKKSIASFRIVVVDRAKDPWGTTLGIVGNYNPRTKKGAFDKEKITFWLSKGAQLTKSVNNLLITQGIITGKKIGVSRISKKRKDRMAAKAKVS